MNTITAISGMNTSNIAKLRSNSTESTNTPVPQTEQQADSFSRSFKGNLTKVQMTPRKKIMGLIAASMLALAPSACQKPSYCGDPDYANFGLSEEEYYQLKKDNAEYNDYYTAAYNWAVGLGHDPEGAKEFAKVHAKGQCFDLIGYLHSNNNNNGNGIIIEYK